ncbi:tRNA lysidine(34) synthetase TilS [Pararhodobacter sp. SW119]|uniref:tRNA lysidine(34) synthetase TilS n=1 Tax=Pararhodobacter sp. SW119 TaxID=2780075 RepID=UPI002474E505|nr:tRNA lysidine(34) synthetase TilS [Pararhodobacter sp. SW119]
MTAPPGAAEAALDRMFAGMGRGAGLGLAVSGGGDSMALLALAAERAPADVSLRAVSVDHGLRPEARDELRLVADLAARLGLPHAVVHWSEAARGNLQAAAREARYRLIANWARDCGVGSVALAHTMDDQAETILLRLARGSGVDGLAGMVASREAMGLRWLRPFLGVARTDLRAALSARGIDWAEDPSNSDPRFHRVRARQALAALAPLGIDAAGLAATAGRMQRARDALEAQTWQALAEHARDDLGTVIVDRTALALGPEIRDRLFAHLLMELTGAPHRPRLAALQRWIDSATARGGTLAGLRLHPEAAGLRLYREARAVAGLRTRVGKTWDGRWRAVPPAPAGAAEIGALGPEGLQHLSRQAAAGLHPHWRETGLSRAALAAQPAIWQGGRLLAAPTALWPAGWAFDVRPAAAPGPRGPNRIE